MDRNIGSSPSSAPPAADALDPIAANASSRQLFAQFKQLLEAAEAKVSGYHELHSMLQNEQRSVGQLERALHLQQRHIDRFTAQDLLVSQLTQQLSVQSQAVEQLQSSCSQHSQQLEKCQAHASALQQEVGQKRKRIDSLMEHGMYQDTRIRGLEKKLQQYKSLCAYFATESQVGHYSSKTHQPPFQFPVALIVGCDYYTSTLPAAAASHCINLSVQKRLRTLELPIPDITNFENNPSLPSRCFISMADYAPARHAGALACNSRVLCL